MMNFFMRINELTELKDKLEQHYEHSSSDVPVNFEKEFIEKWISLTDDVVSELMNTIPNELRDTVNACVDDYGYWNLCICGSDYIKEQLSQYID